MTAPLSHQAALRTGILPPTRDRIYGARVPARYDQKDPLTHVR